MEDMKSTVDSLVLINNALACESIDDECNDFVCYEKLVIERVLQMVRGLIQAELEMDAEDLGFKIEPITTKRDGL